MEKFYIAYSKIHGKGVFANIFFSPEDVVGKCLIPVFNKNIDPNKEYGYSDVSKSLGTLVEKTILEKYLNHSNDPNGELFFSDKLELSLRTIKNITPGEEITVDYKDAFPKIDELQVRFVKIDAKNM